MSNKDEVVTREAPEIEAQLSKMTMEARDVFRVFPQKWPVQDRLEMAVGYDESLKAARARYKPKMDAAVKIQDVNERIAAVERLKQEILESIPNPTQGIPDSEYTDDR